MNSSNSRIQLLNEWPALCFRFKFVAQGWVNTWPQETPDIYMYIECDPECSHRPILDSSRCTIPLLCLVKDRFKVASINRVYDVSIAARTRTLSSLNEASEGLALGTRCRQVVRHLINKLRRVQPRNYACIDVTCLCGLPLDDSAANDRDRCRAAPFAAFGHKLSGDRANVASERQLVARLYTAWQARLFGFVTELKWKWLQLKSEGETRYAFNRWIDQMSSGLACRQEQAVVRPLELRFAARLLSKLSEVQRRQFAFE